MPVSCNSVHTYACMHTRMHTHAHTHTHIHTHAHTHTCTHAHTYTRTFSYYLRTEPMGLKVDVASLWTEVG